MKLGYHVFAAFLVGWVSDPTSETSEMDESGDPSDENAQLQSRETGLTVRSVRCVSDEQDAKFLESAALNLDDLLQDIAPDIAKRWQRLTSSKGAK